MAKDSGSILNMVLIGGAAYLAYQYFMAPTNPGAAPAAGGTGSNPLNIQHISSSGGGANGTITIHVVLAGAVNPVFTVNGSNVQSGLIDQNTSAKEYGVLIPASLAGQTVNVAVSDSGRSANANVSIPVQVINSVPTNQNQVSVTTPVSNPTPTPTNTLLGGVYATKGDFTQAVIKALNTISGGSQSQTIDQWNWFMEHLGFTGFSTGGINPDPVIAYIGIGRNDAMSPVTYINALQTLGMLPYPQGLNGLSALASGISSINRHPLALRAPGGNYGMGGVGTYLRPRKVVI